MARPLHADFRDGWHHVTARGNKWLETHAVGGDVPPFLFLFSLVKRVLMLVTIAVFSSCTPLSDCADTVTLESASADGQLVAVVFERDCGATTAKNTQICFRPRSEPFDSKRQPSFLVFEGDGKVVVSWESPSKLLVRLPQDSKVFRKESEKSGVKIEYEAK